MTKSFEFHKIKLKRDQAGWLIITGEIINNSGRNFNSVVFRIILFIKNIPIGNITFIINGFFGGQTKTFEKQMGDIEYDKVINQITQWEIYPESAY